jgi:hypothetical protein
LPFLQFLSGAKKFFRMHAVMARRAVRLAVAPSAAPVPAERIMAGIPGRHFTDFRTLELRRNGAVAVGWRVG